MNSSSPYKQFSKCIHNSTVYVEPFKFAIERNKRAKTLFLHLQVVE